MSVDVHFFPTRLFSDMFSLQKAVEVMCIVPKRCNDMMNVGRLQGFDVRQTVFFQTKNESMWIHRLFHPHLLKDEFIYVLILSFRGR